MKSTKQEELAQIIPEYIRTKTGAQYNTLALLDQARETYRTTRKSYSLNKRSGTLVESKKTLKVSHHKYSRDDAIWMQDKTPQQIADKFDITVKQANGIKHYCRTFYNLLRI